MKKILCAALSLVIACMIAAPVTYAQEEATTLQAEETSIAQVEATTAAQAEETTALQEEETTEPPAEVVSAPQAEFVAEEAPVTQALDLRTADVSGYMNMELGGGFHTLYENEATAEKKKIFDPAELFGSLDAEMLDNALTKLKALDIRGALTVVIDTLLEVLNPIACDENGESINKNISSDGSMYATSVINSATARYGFDWRLSPLDNADRLNEYIEYIQEKRAGDPKVEKFNIHGLSGSMPLLMAYLEKYGLEDVGSLWIDVTTHNGSSLFGALAKQKIRINVGTLAYADKLGFNELFTFDISSLQPYLRVLYEMGVLSVLEPILKLALTSVIKRVDKEIVSPIFMMWPQFWAYVPAKDFEAAKKAQFGNNTAKYAKLIEKIDAYHYQVQVKADEIILRANKLVKVGVRAGYGLPMLPIGGNVPTQGDYQVDTVYASMGATVSNYGSTFCKGNKQKVDCGHDHISPDNTVDASTCLLPEQTWFAYGKPHSPEYSYSGWYTWFLKTDNPTVNNDEGFPQYVKTTVLANGTLNRYVGTYETYEKPAPVEETFMDTLKSAGLWIADMWRHIVGAPFFWVDFI